MNNITSYFCSFRGKKDADFSPEPPMLVTEAWKESFNLEHGVSYTDVENFWRNFQKENKSTKFLKQFHKRLEEVVADSGAGDSTSQSHKNFPGTQWRKQNSQKKRSDIGLMEFLDLLLDPSMTPSIETEVTQDMDAPLSHYFIYTGHNSYLKGNQLTGQCSTRPIVKSLLRGVRVIELDLWPNDKKTEILVTHGGTLTKPVGFQECLEAVRDFAFVASPFPVMVTLEDHLTNALQAMAAKVISSVFGSTLWTPREDLPLSEYPSPEFLKYRIIISTPFPKQDKGIPRNPSVNRKQKVLQGSLSGNSNGVPSSNSNPNMNSNSTLSLNLNGGNGPSLSRETSLDREKERNSFERETTRLSEVLGALNPFKGSPSRAEKEGEGQGTCPHESPMGSPNEDAEKFQELTREYRLMITVAGGRVKGESPKTSLRESQGVKRVSLSESQLASMAKTNPDDLVRFTQKNILRIYPTGMRVDSSNYKPMLGWIHGAQLVALNMQGYGSALWQVYGFFLGNGASGYVKKPQFLLTKKEEITGGEEEGKLVEDPFSFWNPKYPGNVKKILKVRLLLGTGWREAFGESYYDRFSLPDFYAKISIGGVPSDKASKKLSVKYNKFNPSWEDEVLDFPLSAPELALLKIKVMEYDPGAVDDFAGQVVLPVNFLKEGFRSVPLFGRKGFPLQPKVDKEPKEDSLDKDWWKPYGSSRHLVNQKWEGPRLLFHFEFLEP